LQKKSEIAKKIVDDESGILSLVNSESELICDSFLERQ
tara:strand:- start:46 stop:159 length:114 start_codon:yes stop_codon:yes gene_type:complete